MDIYQTRLARTRELLQKSGAAAVVVTSPPNFFYFCGTWLDSHERLQAIVIPQTGEPTMIVPEMAREQVGKAARVKQAFWPDGSSPMKMLAAVLPESGTISIDNNWPSINLIHLMDLTGKVSYADSTDILGALRLIKDQVEIQALQESSRCADLVMERIISWIRPGLSELEAADEIKGLFRQLGINELAFEPVVAAGPNSGIPHHQPGNTVIGAGDPVLFDIGGVRQHYCSDVTRTVVVGNPNPEVEAVYKVVRSAQDEAVGAVRPGVMRKEIDAVARRVIAEAGYGSYFTHRTGHGLGIEIHEEPFLDSSGKQSLEEGMVLTVEPGIYLPGRFGIRIEDSVVVSAGGAQRLNNVSRRLLTV